MEWGVFPGEKGTEIFYKPHIQKLLFIIFMRHPVVKIKSEMKCQNSA